MFNTESLLTKLGSWLVKTRRCEYLCRPPQAAPLTVNKLARMCSEAPAKLTKVPVLSSKGRSMFPSKASI